MPPMSVGPACSRDCWMRYDPQASRPVGPEQMISLMALVSYVSHKTGRTEYRVERDIADHFCVPNMKCLPADLYDTALRYICDQISPSRL